jgi:hypothetical protein
MAAVPVPNVCKAELFFTLHGQRIENVLSFQSLGTWGDAEMVELGNFLLDWWPATVGLNVSTELQLRYVHLTDLRSPIGPAVDVVPTTTITGSVSNQSLPANNALCVSHRSAFRGRSSRGRTYVPGITEDSTANSVVDSARGEAIRASFDTLRTDAAVVGPGWGFVVVSLRTAGVDRAEGFPFLVQSSILVDLVVDSQRRRLPRRGA